MWILAHDDLDVRYNRQAVLLINEGVRCALEHNVGNQTRLLVRSWVLSYGHGNCKVMVREVRTDCLVTEDDAEAYDCILRVLSPLEEHVHIDVLDQIELLLGGLDVVIFLGIVSLFFFFVYSSCLLALGFGIRLAALCGSLVLTCWLCFSCGD